MKKNEEVFSEKDKALFREGIKNHLSTNKRGDVVIKGLSGEVAVAKYKEIPLEEAQKELTPEKINEMKLVLGKSYEEIIEVLKQYCDLREEFYPIVATWILGTYLHKSFNTFPYLFVNAMRGSGKTRLLKLISSLASKGQIIGSPTEAVLFRIPTDHTLCIDEFEGVMRKGNEGVRELLNASYKRGMCVYRMKKVNTPEGTEQKVEEFEPYRPICLANIWGMEEVLGDRCITMILEKSGKKNIMRIIEDFEENILIKSIKSHISVVLVYMCSYFRDIGYIKEWNKYVNSKYTTLTTLTTQTTETTQTTPPKLLEMFNKIDGTGINGRDLELFFPLLIVGDFVGPHIFEKIIEYATTLTKEKRTDEMAESRDIAMIEWVSTKEMDRHFYTVKKITQEFRDFLGDDDEKDEAWINTRWVGRALKRLNMILDKRRTNKGMEVTLNAEKAKEKIKFMKG